MDASRLSLLEEAADTTDPRNNPPACPICGKVGVAESAVCVFCGFNRATGQTAPTFVRRDAEAVEEEKSPLPIRAVEFFGELLPGLFRPGIVVAATLVAVVGFAVMGLGLFVLGLGAMMEGMFIAGGGLIVYGQALGLLLYGEWGWLPECLAECKGLQWLVFFVLLAAPFAGLYFMLRPYIPR